jgi:hypothetical protein
MQKIIKYLRLPFVFDKLRLQEETNRLSSHPWQEHYQKLHYEGEWSAIPLRSIDGNAHSILISPLNTAEYKDTVFLNDCPYIQEVLSDFKCPLKAVRLLKLKAGAIIKEHTDAELCFEKGEIRIHVPVTTNDKVEFYLDNERLDLKEGESWYMNFNLPHRVSNNSDQDRIHLVVDAEVDDWVKDLFTSDTVTNKKEINQHELLDESTRRQMIERFRAMNTETANRLADKWEATLKQSESQ